MQATLKSDENPTKMYVKHMEEHSKYRFLAKMKIELYPIDKFSPQADFLGGKNDILWRKGESKQYFWELWNDDGKGYTLHATR